MHLLGCSRLLWRRRLLGGGGLLHLQPDKHNGRAQGWWVGCAAHTVFCGGWDKPAPFSAEAAKPELQRNSQHEGQEWALNSP
jgi:hypothetical protein